MEEKPLKGTYKNLHKIKNIRQTRKGLTNTESLSKKVGTGWAGRIF
jgi:hypothetical protein